MVSKTLKEVLGKEEEIGVRFKELELTEQPDCPVFVADVLSSGWYTLEFGSEYFPCEVSFKRLPGDGTSEAFVSLVGIVGAARRITREDGMVARVGVDFAKFYGQRILFCWVPKGRIIIKGRKAFESKLLACGMPKAIEKESANSNITVQKVLLGE